MTPAAPVVLAVGEGLGATAPPLRHGGPPKRQRGPGRAEPLQEPQQAAGVVVQAIGPPKRAAK